MGRTTSKPENKAIGNLALDRFLGQSTSQPFLQRNLRVIFDRHKQELERQDSISRNMTSESIDKGEWINAWNSYDNNKLRKWIDTYTPKAESQRSNTVSSSTLGWRLNAGNLDAANVKFHLMVNTVVLRPRRQSQQRSKDDEAKDNEPSWLWLTNEDPAVTTCTISVNPDQAGRPGDAEIGRAVRTGRLVLLGEDIHIKFDESMRLPLPPLSKDENGHATVWLRVMLFGRSQLLGGLRINDAGPQDTLASFRGYDTNHVVTTKRVKVAVLANTTRGMEKYDLGPVQAPIRNLQLVDEPTLLDASISIAVTWREPPSAPTPLSAFHDSTQALFERRHQLPTPDASQDLDFDTTVFRITYVFKQDGQTRRYLRRDLQCPLCQRDLGIESFTRLLLHFRIQHAHFDFQAETDTISDRNTVSKTVNMSIAHAGSGPQPKANIRGKDEVKIDWVAPSTPFDEELYTSGYSHWDQQRTESTAPIKKLRKVTEYAEPLPEPVSPRRVKPLSVRVPQMHPVPRAKDANGNQIRFYRTSSKKVLKPGELVAESDEEVDESWLQVKQKQNVKRLTRDGKPLSQGEQDFIIDWNNHITQEQRQGATSDRLKRDSIIRFAQRYRRKLAIPDWQAQFAASLGRMVQRRVITEEDREYCLKEDEASSQISDVVDGGTQSRLTTRARRTSDDETPTKPAMDLCICGERVFGVRGIIYCENAHCPHDAFHLKCLGLNERVPDWHCHDCAEAAD